MVEPVLSPAQRERIAEKYNFRLPQRFFSVPYTQRINPVFIAKFNFGENKCPRLKRIAQIRMVPAATFLKLHNLAIPLYIQIADAVLQFAGK